MQTKRHIILQDKTGFLEPLLKQTYQDCIIEQEYDLEKINENYLFIINQDTVQSELSYLCPTILLTSILDKPEGNPQIQILTTPFKYRDLVHIINASKQCSARILPNAWINTKTLVTIFSNIVSTKDLTSIEIKLLEYLASNDCSFKSKNDILRHVFSYKDNTDTNTLETNIYRLRKKLEPEILILRDENNGYMLKR